jgi:hypothetical protein
MRMWTKIGIGVAAVLLAVVAAGGAYAMWGGDDGDGQQTTRDLDEDTGANPQAASDDGEGSGALGICIEGTIDCVDTPLNEDPGAAAGGTCLEGTTDCVDAPIAGRCLPEAPDCDDTLDPGFTCEPGLTVEQCLPDGIPADYECVTLESDPIVVKCSPIDCVTILPAPADIDQQTGDVAVEDEIKCEPPVDECVPGADGSCLPPDCAVSSDGSVACPETDSGAGANEPGVTCPSEPAAAAEECARAGGGTDGAAPSDSGPAPVAEQ